MPGKILDFNTVLITGGGGGIGFALAEYFQSLDKKVIIAGRTEEKLVEASKKLKDAPYYTLDTGNIPSLKGAVEQIVKDHPDVDALVNNAGVQRPLDVANLDLDKADVEININIRGPIHLATHFLPHFAQKKNATIVNVSSVLGLCPFSIINPVYNGTKAFVHFWSLNQRTQLAAAHPHIRVAEILPPSVGTDLHRERENPDDNKKEKGAKNSLTIDEFMKGVKEDFEADKEEIGAGPAHAMIDKWQDTFGGQYKEAAAGYER